ncbi:MAG: HAD hydrolase-like protein [Magnetovibrio sp.]|nr:HAD hydrolase-like protein [Magnetovibrio sp.]
MFGLDKNIKCVVFDFDGTLVDSNHIKRDGFYAVTQDIPGSHKVLDNIFNGPSPGDRHAIFKTFTEYLGLAKEEGLTLTERYSQYCFEEIMNCNYMKGAKTALNTLFDLNINMFMNSATPQNALKTVVDAMELSPYFRGVYGGPIAKEKNLLSILNSEQVRPCNTVVVGDGQDDADSAIKTGCNFVPVFEARSVKDGGDKLDDLAQLPALLSLA